MVATLESPPVAEAAAAMSILNIKDGIYPGLGRPSYELIDAINYSSLKHFERTAAHARENMVNPKPATDAMELGSAEHLALLEPERFAAEYIVAPVGDKRTKAVKEAWDELVRKHPGKEIIKSEDMDLCKGMMAAAYAHPDLRNILTVPGRNEVVIVWTDPETGQRCKGMLDRVCRYQGWTIVPDLKTTRNASPHEFARQAETLLYFEQAAFYLWGLATIKAARRRFVWAAIETAPPHCVCLYEPDTAMLADGAAAFRRHLNSYVACKQSDQWPGYPAGIQTLSRPRWATTQADGE